MSATSSFPPKRPMASSARLPRPGRLGSFGLLAAALAGFGSLVPATASAAELIGTWQTEGRQSQVVFAPCGSGHMCGKISWLREPNDPKTGQPRRDTNNEDLAKRSRPLLGVTLATLSPDVGGSNWSGKVYNPLDGKTYDGGAEFVGANAIRLKGCVLGRVICKGQTWTRVAAAGAPADRTSDAPKKQKVLRPPTIHALPPPQ